MSDVSLSVHVQLELLKGYLVDIFKCITEMLAEMSNIKLQLINLCESIIKGCDSKNG